MKCRLMLYHSPTNYGVSFELGRKKGSLYMMDALALILYGDSILSIALDNGMLTVGAGLSVKSYAKKVKLLPFGQAEGIIRNDVLSVKEPKEVRLRLEGVKRFGVAPTLNNFALLVEYSNGKRDALYLGTDPNSDLMYRIVEGAFIKYGLEVAVADALNELCAERLVQSFATVSPAVLEAVKTES